ncbi:MAG: HD domain-containing protein [Peptostreptococcaceae bacterium]
MSSKDVFHKVNKILLESMKPSDEIKSLIKEGYFDKEPFNSIKKLDKIDQNPKYHPEGSVLNHVLLVVDKASEHKDESIDRNVFMWSALLHDIGKLTTTKIRKNRITSYNHDIEGEKIALEFLDKLTEDEEFKHKVSKLVKWHMQPLFFDKNLPFFNPKDMLNEVEYKEVALLSLCDRLGRGGMTLENLELEENRINNFIEHFREK